MSARLSLPTFPRLSSLAFAALAMVVLAACGGGDSNSSATLTSSGEPNGSGGGTNSLLIIGTPSEVHGILGEAVALDRVDMYLLTSLSQDPAAFDGVTFGGTDQVWGVQILGPQEGTAADFNAAYSERFGDVPPGAPVWNAYDAVYAVALAATAANTDAGIRDNLTYVSNSPGEIAGYGSDAFAAAVEALNAEAGDVNYIGASGQVDFDASGAMSKGVVQTWKVLNGQIALIETRDVDLASEAGVDVPTGELSRLQAEAQVEPLTIGVLVTDDEIGTALGNAAQLAVDEINAAGGVYGQDVVLSTQTIIGAEDAGAAVQALADAGAGAIVGPVAADAVGPALDAAKGASVPLLSLSDAASLSVLDGEGFLFRMVPSIELQMPVLRNLSLDSDAGTFCVLYSQGGEGQAMADAFKRAVDFSGETLQFSEPFDPAAEDHAALLESCLGS
jgi:ABC-type branched-subunit amino acid transport system substrate-binding protein